LSTEGYRSGEKIKTEILSFPRGLTIYARVSNSRPLRHMSHRQQLNCIYCIILGFFLYAGIFARAFGTGQFIDDLKWWLLPRQEDKMKLEMEVKKADAIVLTYSCDRAQTLDRLSTYWLPELRRLEVSCLSSLSCSMPWSLVYLSGRQSKLLVNFFFSCVLLMLYVPLVDQSAGHCCWMQVRSP
jgi:hypothetical protein